MGSSIQVDNISKSFNKGKKKAVRNLTFSVEPGDIFCLIGQNGAGKTTTLRMLGTLLRPDSGSIYINGTDIALDPWKARGEIGFLTSKLKLEECFTPEYLFRFFAKLYGMDENKILCRREELFDLFSINDFAKIPVARLSDGMRQKVSLAISLVHDPSIIIYDEPTNGLDVIASKTVADFLIGQKNAGKTIVMSTHIFELIEKTATKVGLMIDGRMAASGSLEEICRGKSLEERFFEIYNSEGDALH